MLDKHFVITVNKIESQIITVNIDKMNKVNNENDQKHNQLGYNIVQTFLVHISVGLHHLRN